MQFTLLSYWYERVVAQTAEPPEPVEPNYRTVTGDPAVFNARYSYPIKDLSVNIQGTQELNGYDKPWVGGAGKNKLPDSSHATVLNAYLNGDNVLATSSPDRTVIMPCEASTVYTFTWNKVPIAGRRDDNYSIASFTDLPSIGSTGTRIAYGATATNLTFQTASDARYLAIKISNTTRTEYPTTLNISMLEKGSTATAFEPYENICPITAYDSVTVTQSGSQTNTYEVELTGAGQVYKGTLDVTSGELVVDFAELVLNGKSSEAWTTSSTSNTGMSYFYVNQAVNADTTSDYVCDSFDIYYGKMIASTPATSNLLNISNADASYRVRVMVLTSLLSANTVAGFKAWLANNPITIYYRLATPLTYQLTPTQLSNLIGQNSIKADAGEVTVTYRTDARTEYKVYPYQYSYKYGGAERHDSQERKAQCNDWKQSEARYQHRPEKHRDSSVYSLEYEDKQPLRLQ